MARENDIVRLSIDIRNINQTIGRSYIELRIALRERDRKMTVDHRMVKKYVTISISGEFKDGYNWSGGQCQDAIRNADLSNRVTPERTVKRILSIWDEWHLNDMNAGCEHQSSVSANDKNYWDLAKEQTEKCPHGYRYGSAWLLKEIPKEVVAEAISLFGSSIEKYPELVEFYS